MDFEDMPEEWKKYVIGLGMKLFELENRNPITSDEVFDILQDIVKYVSQTRITNIKELLFINGDYTLPRLKYLWK